MRTSKKEQIKKSTLEMIADLQLDVRCATLQFTNYNPDSVEGIMDCDMTEGLSVEKWIESFPEDFTFAYGHIWFKNGGWAEYSPDNFYWEYYSKVRIPKRLIQSPIR